MKPKFLILTESYLRGSIDAEIFENEFLELRRSQMQSGKYDFNLSDPCVGLGYDLIFSLTDRLNLQDDLEPPDISEITFRLELSKIVKNIHEHTPQKRSY
jgi:hypothetical protein